MLVEREIQDTYNIQVVEQRSHSLAFGFPPEGDFAPEAHYTQPTPPHKKKNNLTGQKQAAETQRSGFQKQLN